jgi:predicted  nucleic acid-binding Zn-ribbon protein
MLPELQNLLELQKADREILRLNEEIAALPKRVAAIEAKLAGTKALLENAKLAVKADDAAKRKYESTIKDVQQKISKYRDQMLDVKTNEQYKAFQQEINFAEKEIQGAEDKILELMLNADARDKQVKAAEADLKAETAEIETEKAQARERTAEDEKLLAEWNAKRDQFRTGIPDDLLRHYDRVVKLRKTGLSEVRDQKCLACQVMLRPQTYNEVRSGTSVIICDSCQRILYFDPATEVVAEKFSPAVRRRHRPKDDSAQAWFYRPQYGEHGEVLLAFVNSGGRSTRRIYDFNTGRQVGDILEREGEYRLAFPEDISGDYVRLNGSWNQEEVESWAEEMPMTALDSLHADLQAARAESAKHSENREPAEALHTSHPAAS